MAKWHPLRATFPDEEIDEINRIRDRYGISYNEIIRSGVKFYLALTMAKELLATTSFSKKIKVRNKPLSEYLNNPKYQSQIEQKIIKLIKIVITELIEKGIDYEQMTKPIRKERKVGRPKKPRKVGRPSLYE